MSTDEKLDSRPLMFGPANGDGSSFEMIDLDEVFLDDFFPSDLDFSSYFRGMADSQVAISPHSDSGNYSEKNGSVFMEGLSNSLELFISSESTTVPSDRPVSYSEQVNHNVSSKGVIMIPPSMPRIPPARSPKSSLNEDAAESPTVKREHKQSSIEDSICEYDGDEGDYGSKKKKRKLVIDLKDMTEAQRVERRERNREHAKRSRIRKKILLDTLQGQLFGLRQANVLLRRIVADRLPKFAAKIFETCTTEESRLLMDTDDVDCTIDISDLDESFRVSGALEGSSRLSSRLDGSASSSSSAVIQSIARPMQKAKILMEPDFRLVQSLICSQQNFCLSDPSLPDNPIVYCSDGFCKLSGYKKNQVLGRNCRFLQGPGTDQAAVDIISKGIAQGSDISVCLLNYKADGSTFWNQFFVAALRDADGVITNYVGVQCEVTAIPITAIKDRVKRLPIPDHY